MAPSDPIPDPDPDIAAALAALAREREGRSFCPSEVARRVADDWRPLMPAVRAAAAAMPEMVATQRGVPVDPATARGPIRLALRGPASG